MIYPFCLKEWKLKKVEKLVANLNDKIEYVVHIKNFKASIKPWISI